MTKLEREIHRIKEQRAIAIKTAIMKANLIGRKVEKLGRMPI